MGILSFQPDLENVDRVEDLCTPSKDSQALAAASTACSRSPMTSHYCPPTRPKDYPTITKASLSTTQFQAIDFVVPNGEMVNWI